MKLSEKIQEALRQQQEINLSDPAVQKRLAAQWGYVPADAQPAPSVPEDVMRDARRYLWLRNAALDWYVGPEYATYNDVVCSGEYCNYAGGGVALDSAIDALLAAAPEAKP